MEEYGITYQLDRVTHTVLGFHTVQDAHAAADHALAEYTRDRVPCVTVFRVVSTRWE